MKPTTIGRNRKQEEERGAEQAELLRLELKLGHDRHAGKTDHDLVREIHQHKEKQEKCDFPGAFGRRLRGHGRFPVIICWLCLIGHNKCYPRGIRQCNPAFWHCPCALHLKLRHGCRLTL